METKRGNKIKIGVELLEGLGPRMFRFEGHAPDERYCAALSFFKEQLETHIKYFKNGYEIHCWQSGTPEYSIELMGFTDSCVKTLGVLLISLKELINSMNAEYPGSCEYEERLYNDDDGEV